MPLLIGVDVSLSMHPFLSLKAQHNSSTAPNATLILHDLLLKYDASSGVPHDFICLAHLCEDVSIAIEFTKDHNHLFQILGLNFPVRGTKLNFARCVSKILKHSRTAWSTLDDVQCLILTHASAYVPDCEDVADQDLVELRTLLKTCHIPMHFVIFSHPNRSSNLNRLMRSLEDLLLMNPSAGTIHVVNCTSDTDWKKLVDDIYEVHLKPEMAYLQFGKLKTEVNVVPRIKQVTVKQTSDSSTGKMSNIRSLNIFGFTKQVDLGNPVVVSRHLLIARSRRPSQVLENTKTPNLCVLLHGCAKVSELVALCRIDDNCFGFISDFADGKRSNFVLNAFEPGFTCIPWLDDFRKMSYLPYDPQGTANPIQPSSRRVSLSAEPKPSYSSSSQSWIHTYGLQSDIQKISRYLKKLPEKDALFYQELNRTLNYALSLGCTELISYLKESLTNEKAANTLTSIQLDHANYILKALSGSALKRGEPVPALFK